ncbi:MAG: SRPBCC family protein [Halobacteriaceae archaeon]
MTVRVERTVHVNAPPEQVWGLVADPAFRAGAIDVVAAHDVDDDGATWEVELPLVPRTLTVETTENESDPPQFVRFVGRSAAFHVVGEHELEPADGGTRLRSRFTVDGRLPGVERFFEANLDAELERLERALQTQLASE